MQILFLTLLNNQGEIQNVNFDMTKRRISYMEYGRKYSIYRLGNLYLHTTGETHLSEFESREQLIDFLTHGLG